MPLTKKYILIPMWRIELRIVLSYVIFPWSSIAELPTSKGLRFINNWLSSRLVI